eukprot:TRINITY_DN1050_c0_g1_i3.p1 TRINITY_DN1050_c0_g1~~TRINITY_DN1050_c0_g1_i3.p1  ORF type:complete len:306 (+),score=91.07 TRINITY_DN1050_c0_g1_i3:31-948(+)
MAMWRFVRTAGTVGAASMASTRQAFLEEGRFDGKKQQMVFGYEARIRRFSSPEKNFSVFATATAEGMLQMTPFDFVKSLMHFSDESRDAINANPPVCFKLLDADHSGTLSFTEYMLLLTLLAVSERDARSLFNVLDADGNGYLDHQEFDLLVKTMNGAHADKLGRQAGAPRAMSMVQVPQQQQQQSGAVQLTHYSRRLPGGADRVTKADFLNLHRLVHRGVLQLEFESQGGSVDKGIDAPGFQRLVQSYASKDTILEPELGGKALQGRISFDEYCHFHEVVLEIDEIERSLRFSLGARFMPVPSL